MSHNCLFIPYDLQELENIESIFENIKAKGIKLDGMVYCAGFVIHR